MIYLIRSLSGSNKDLVTYVEAPNTEAALMEFSRRRDARKLAIETDIEISPAFLEGGGFNRAEWARYVLVPPAPPGPVWERRPK